MIGTITNYIDGTSLDYHILYNANIKYITNLIIKLIPSIKELSKNYICVGDVFINNIIYNKDGFHFIDTASYYYTDEYPIYIYKRNIISIMLEIFGSLLGSYENGLINKYLFSVDNSYNYHYDLEMLLNSIDLLENIKHSLEKYCDKNIDSFSDTSKMLQMKLQKYF